MDMLRPSHLWFDNTQEPRKKIENAWLAKARKTVRVLHFRFNIGGRRAIAKHLQSQLEGSVDAAGCSSRVFHRKLVHS